VVVTIDIGNTNVTIGLYDGDKLKTTWRLSSVGPKTTDECRLFLRDSFVSAGLNPKAIKGSILCSVVPRLTPAVKQALEQLTDVRALVVGQDVRVPLTNAYKDPSQVGQDRLVNAFSGWTRYGGPLIVVDFGTAITLDVVSKDRKYLGGVIAPGIEISLEALSQRTALLPRVELEPPAHVLGTSTKESIQSGMLFGFSALCDGLVERLRQETAPHAKVVATGGYAELISTYCKYIDCVHPELTLDGLKLLWESRQAD